MTKKKTTKSKPAMREARIKAVQRKKKPAPAADHTEKWRAAGIKAAITLLTRNGYKVTKPSAKPTKKPKTNGEKNGNGLNAIGRPYGASYDPNYRMKHKPSYAHLYKSNGRSGNITAVSPERWEEMCANAKAHWDYSRKHGTPLPMDIGKCPLPMPPMEEATP